MKFKQYYKQILGVLVIITIGIVLAVFVLKMPSAKIADYSNHNNKEEHKEDSHTNERNHVDTNDEHHQEGKVQKGAHGGRLFSEGGYGVEVTIFEQGIPPQFRLYTYKDGKLIDPAASEITLTLERLGRKPHLFKFTKENDYLYGDAVVEEPHSFKVKIAAQYDNKSYLFGYQQEEERVTISDQILKDNGIQISTAGPVRITNTLQLMGEIHLNNDRTVHVVPRLSGVVESVLANAGDTVKKGQLLAVIASQVLVDQRSELLAAQQRLVLARVTYEREKKLWAEKISAEQDYLQARHAMQEAEIVLQSSQQKLASLGAMSGAKLMTTAGSGNLVNLARYEIRSPISGMITDKRLSMGEIVKDDSNIFSISDLSSMWAEINIPTKDLNKLKIGQKVVVKALDFDARTDGKIAYIGSIITEQNRTAQARIILANPKGVWRAGLPINVELLVEGVDVAVAVSVNAIQTVRDWKVVFVRYGNQLEARPLELGRTDGQWIEVIKGLNVGEPYVANNSFLVKAELGKASASHDH